MSEHETSKVGCYHVIGGVIHVFRLDAKQCDCGEEIFMNTPPPSPSEEI